jgi:phosphocarrier protein
LENLVCETTIEIKNANGLHMRPAMKVVDLASKFKSDITVSNDKGDVDAKSIMQMCLLEATVGTEVTIRAKGSDAREAVDALRDLFENVLAHEPTETN